MSRRRFTPSGRRKSQQGLELAVELGRGRPLAARVRTETLASATGAFGYSPEKGTIRGGSRLSMQGGLGT